MYQLLIVDDHPDQVHGLADTIDWASLGIAKVHKAYSGQEALELMQIQTIDIIITDIRMPGMSGLEMMEKIRESSSAPRIIILSGYSDFEYAQKAIGLNAVQYLMKPVDIGELTRLVRSIVEQLDKEMEHSDTYRRVMYSYRSNIPVLRRQFLIELLQGQEYSASEFNKKTELLELQVSFGSPFVMFMIRMEEEFRQFGKDLPLLEYAVANMAEEIFQNDFKIWSAKDNHDYLVFLAHAKMKDLQPEKHVELCCDLARELQRNVRHFLKGKISIVMLGLEGQYPRDLPRYYETVLGSMRKQIDKQREFLIKVDTLAEKLAIRSMETLYQPPLLIYLMETGRWEEAQGRLHDIFDELGRVWHESPEYMIETYRVLISSYTYFTHKYGKEFGELQLDVKPSFQSPKQMMEWAANLMDRLKQFSEQHHAPSRMSVLEKVELYVQSHLDKDISLQAIADHVHLHPVYLSKIYKLEKGIGLSEYIFRHRMEQAGRLLKESDAKIYEIAKQLGYQTTHYFIKVFKKYYGQTPQEFRDLR